MGKKLGTKVTGRDKNDNNNNKKIHKKDDTGQIPKQKIIQYEPQNLEPRFLAQA